MSERSLSISACMWERALSASAVSVAIVDSLAANSAWYSSAALRTCRPPQKSGQQAQQEHKLLQNLHLHQNVILTLQNTHSAARCSPDVSELSVCMLTVLLCCRKHAQAELVDNRTSAQP